MACAGACAVGAAGSVIVPAAIKSATALGTAAAAFMGVRSLKRRRNKRKRTKKRNKRNKTKKRNKTQKGGRQRLLTKRSKK